MRLSFLISALVVWILCFGCAKKDGSARHAISDSAYLPSTVSRITAKRGTRAIFRDLVAEGKLDPELAQALSKARNKDTFDNIIVFVSGPSYDAEAILKKLVAKTPKLAGATPFAAFSNLSSEKELFLAQLRQGLANGDFHRISIDQDIKEIPALLLRGEARDIFKIAQLPNVERLAVK